MEPTKSGSNSNVLFDKSKTKSDQEDIWDDRALIRAYERSMRQVNQKLSGTTSKTVQSATEAKVEAYREDEDDDEDDDDDAEFEDDDEYEDEIEYKPESKTANLKKKPNPTDWSVGDLCMAIFSEDGLVYPANIIRIDADKCRVRYLHYLNEEDKQLDELFENSSEKVEECKRESAFSKPAMFLHPPPPMPIPTVPSLNSNVTEDEALHSMLISWYMSGYHTGFYYGLRNARSEPK